jgi:WXG100 family type VII secretion target
MDDTINQCKSIANQVTTILETMNSDTKSKMSYWTGAAKNQYDATYQTCSQLALQLPQALETARLTLDNIYRTLLEAESSNSKTFSGH